MGSNPTAVKLYWGLEKTNISIIISLEAVFLYFGRLRQGSVAEWSKALVLGTSHFGGVGSNPTTIKEFFNAGGTDCSLFTSLMQLAVTKGNV